MKALVPTQHYDMMIIQETADTMETTSQSGQTSC